VLRVIPEEPVADGLKAMNNFDKKLLKALNMLENPVSEGVLDDIMQSGDGADTLSGKGQDDVGADAQAKDDLNDVNPEDIKKAQQEQGAGEAAEELQDELADEKEDRETRDAQRQKELDPLVKQANQSLRHIGTDATSIAAGHENLADNIENLSDQKSELAKFLDEIDRLLS
jgi:DNA repair exonuclease SbcCD ATPase subunit